VPPMAAEQSGVLSVLINSAAIDRRPEFRFVRQPLGMHRNLCSQDRFVNAMHGRSRGFVVHAHHDAVGVEKSKTAVPSRRNSDWTPRRIVYSAA